MKLYAHQEKIIKEDPKKAGLFLGTGSGKTRIALLLASGRTLVIAPKTQVDDGNWTRELKAIERDKYLHRITYLEVMTFDLFKRDAAKLGRFNTVIVDEAHGMLGLTPNTRQVKRVEIPKASQRYDELFVYLNRTQPARIYLCTATITKSPMTVLAAKAILEGSLEMKDFFTFRHQFYNKLPMPGREVYSPVKTDIAKDALAAMVHRLGYVGRLEDYFDVPEQTYKTVHVDLTAKQKERLKDLNTIYPELIVRVGKRHQVENGVLIGDEFTATELFSNGKLDAILDYAAEFPRMVVFVKYTAQLEHIAAEVAHAGYKVLTMTGATTDRGSVIAEANASPACVFIVQAQISAGWELPAYPVMIFASRTYSFVDYDQGIGRIQRANNIKKNLYINLVVKGGVDEAVDAAISNKQDFAERVYAEQL